MRLRAFIVAATFVIGCHSSPKHDTAPSTVNGVVVNDRGGPVAAAIVMIEGHGVVTTGADGAFSFTAVTSPYTVAARSPDGAGASVYVGLTRGDPIVNIPIAGVGPPKVSPYRAIVKGQLAGGAGFPQPAGHSVDFSFSPVAGAPSSISNIIGNSDGTYSVTISWTGEATIVGTLHALQWLADASQNATSFDGVGDVSVTLTPNQTLLGQNIQLAAVSKTRVDGTIAVAAGYTLEGRSLRTFYVSSGSLLLDYDGGPGLPATYDWPVFSTNGVAYRITAIADDPNNAFSEAWRVTDGSRSVDVVVPAAPVFGQPSPSATAVQEGATFSWSAVAGAVYDVELSPSNVGAGPSIRIVTSATAFQVPNLSSIGFSWPKSVPYRVDLSAFAPRTPDDVAAGAEQPSGEADGAYAVAPTGSFTTAP